MTDDIPALVALLISIISLAATAWMTARPERHTCETLHAEQEQQS